MIAASVVFVVLGVAALLRQLLAGGDLWAYLSLACGVLALASLAGAAHRRRIEPSAGVSGPDGVPVSGAVVTGSAPSAPGARAVPDAPGASASPAVELVGATGTAPVSADPPDEPGIEATPPERAQWLSGQQSAVSVLDGRPRYHRSSCGYLSGRRPVSLPVSAARASGFTPCGYCRPDAALARAADLL